MVDRRRAAAGAQRSWAFRLSAAGGRARPTSSSAASTTPAGIGSRSRRTGSCTATARPRTRTCAIRSRSIRRTSRTRTRRAITGAAFDVPASWPESRRCCASRASTRACARGSTARTSGTARGSRLPAEFDVGWALRPGEENVLAVRVHQWSSGSYLEDQDMWWLSGIFRDVSLLARPPDAIDDVFVHADYDHVTGAGILRVDASVRRARGDPGAGRRRRRVARPRSSIGSSRGAPRCRGSTTCVVASAGERVVLPIGFRRVAIEDDLLLVNGHRVLLRGVNRHEFSPDVRAGGDRGGHAPRRRADEGAQHQRGADEPLSAAPAVPVAVRRVRAVRDRRVRPRDARVLRGRLAAQPGRRARLGGARAWTGCGGWSSATRTTRA